MSSALSPLRMPAFRRLALGRFVDELGDWLGEIALAVLVFDRTGSPMATAALFLALQFAPAIATPPLVARLEGLHSRLSLTGLNVLQAAVFAALAAVSTDFSLVVVIALAMVAGSVAVSGRTLTRAAAAAMLSPRGMLREGNALLNIGFTAGAALGPAIAGLVVAGAGVRTALVACIASSIGGAGNGIQWVGLMTAVQELTQSGYQARVISLLESLAKAMPGIGFLLGGALAAIFNPRVSYAVAGAGVLAVLAIAGMTLSRAGWRAHDEPDVEPVAGY